MSDAARVPGGTITSLLGRYFPALARMSESSRRMNMRLMFELVRGGFLMLLIVLASPPFGSELPLSGGPSPGSSDDAAAIAKAIGEFKDAYNQGDLEKTMGVFGDDLVYIGAGAPTRSGKDALDSWRASLQDTFAHYDRALDIVSEEIRVSGNMGIERGYVNLVLTPKAGGAPLNEKHRFLDVWEKRNGKWKLTVGMNNK